MTHIAIQEVQNGKVVDWLADLTAADALSGWPESNGGARSYSMPS
jgi:hypothetical protein